MVKNLRTITRLLMVAALVVAGNVNAFAGNEMYNVYNTQAQTYPAGSGVVYVDEEDCEEPTAEQYADSVSFRKVVYDDDSYSVTPFCKPANDCKLLFAGWAKLDSLTNISKDVDYLSNVDESYPTLSVGCVESYDTQEAADSALSAGPAKKNYLVACFVAVKASMQEKYSSLGEAEIDKILNNFGDTVKVKLSPYYADVHVDYWLVNGEKVEATTGDSIVFANVQEAKDVVLVPKSKNLKTVTFPKDGGYAMINIPANHEARIIDYGMTGIRVNEDSYNADYSTIWTGNSTSASLAGGIEYGVTYVVEGKGEQEYYMYEDKWQLNTPTYLMTATEETTIEVGDKPYYTWNSKKLCFDPVTTAAIKLNAGDAYITIPADKVVDKTCPIIFSNKKITKPELELSNPVKTSAMATDGKTRQYMYNPDTQEFLGGEKTAEGTYCEGAPVCVEANKDGKTYTIKFGDSAFYWDGKALDLQTPDGKTATQWTVATADTVNYTISYPAAGDDCYLTVLDEKEGTIGLGEKSNWQFLSEEQFDDIYDKREAELAEYQAAIDTYNSNAETFRKGIKTGINTVTVTTTEKAGKFLENGRIVIRTNGKKFTVAGTEIK